MEQQKSTSEPAVAEQQPNLEAVAVPPQEAGVQMDLSKTVVAEQPEAAAALFAEAKERLAKVNEWHIICGSASAQFQVTDGEGNPKEASPPQPADYIRIGLPAPGSPVGEGYDWVQVEMVETQEEAEGGAEHFFMRVRPTDNPLNEKDDIAHFYTDEATSTFMVERRGNEVTASVHGRNEVPNIAKTESLADKARNALVALPALVGLAKVQWNSLVSGVLGE